MIINCACYFSNTYRSTTTSDQWPLDRIVPFQKERLIWNGYHFTLKIILFYFGIVIQSAVAQLVTQRAYKNLR